MLQSSAVADYLNLLGRELSYDPLLSRRVRLEVEDHLWEAAANEGGDAAEAQRRTIEKFGDPREIARQYAALSIFSQIRRVAFIVVLTPVDSPCRALYGKELKDIYRIDLIHVY